MAVFRWLTFLFESLALTPIVLLLWICLFLLTVVFFWVPGISGNLVVKSFLFALRWLFPPLGDSDHIVVSVFIYFHWTQKRMSFFIAWLMIIFVLIEMDLMIISVMTHWCMSLNSMLLLLLPNFVCGFMLELQVKPHSSPWFSAACAADIAYADYFFSLHQQNKSFPSRTYLKLHNISVISSWLKTL